MSRVINTNSPGKVRNQCRRTIAEVLRRLSQKPQVDKEAKDMVAIIVYMLREIERSVEKTVTAWEKRDYWMKAERFLRDWEWAKEAAANFEDVVRHGSWELLPQLIVDLLPHFADIEVKKMTRPASTWRGAYEQLLEEPPSPLPW